MSKLVICASCNEKQLEPTPIRWCKYCFGYTLVDAVKYTSLAVDELVTGKSNYRTLEIEKIDNEMHLKIHGGFYLTKEDLEMLFERLASSASKNKKKINDFNLSMVAAWKQAEIDEISMFRYFKSTGDGYTYLAYNSNFDMYKIGYSYNPEKRVKNFKSRLVHKIRSDNCNLSEWKLHKALEPYNVPKEKSPSGIEWFNLSKDQVDYICSIKEYKNNTFYFNSEVK